MGQKTQYWARYDVNFHSVMNEIWSVLDDEVPSHYRKEDDPHLTIHPRFQFEVDESERFKHYVYDIFPTSVKLDINGFYYHPDKYQPMVICLDVDTNIPFRDLQLELVDTISRNGGKNVIDTAPPHITVYKSKDKGSGFRNIPTNVNMIKTRCENLGSSLFPISVGETKLEVEQAPYK